MILKPLDGHVENVELKASLKQLYYEAMATYLGDLSDVNVSAAEAEITIAKTFLQDKFGSEKTHLETMKSLPFFTATCEASFSTIPVAFGGIAPSVKSYAPLDLLSISNEELLRLFHKAKNFVLQLYSTRSHIIKY
ncbi:hypothetical protein T4B_9762 [Trichinella pseudospiralis]|uniref:Uncharacterized protein n=1 Tax=Trichinella pseudospiralis TaxID=6337 RepID=A0A0V1IUW7_TRIPS|nr:hypothetical protein T4B_9762 [Trichinella pseudospiralis]